MSCFQIFHQNLATHLFWNISKFVLLILPLLSTMVEVQGTILRRGAMHHWAIVDPIHIISWVTSRISNMVIWKNGNLAKKYLLKSLFICYICAFVCCCFSSHAPGYVAFVCLVHLFVCYIVCCSVPSHAPGHVAFVCLLYCLFVCHIVCYCLSSHAPGYVVTSKISNMVPPSSLIHTSNDIIPPPPWDPILIILRAWYGPPSSLRQTSKNMKCAMSVDI